MEQPIDTAVLFLIFNRPETTERVFEAIRQARPPRLYVSADGARADRAGEAQRCEQALRIATAVDWPCELHTQLHTQNLGCRRAVTGAIDWFFGQEAEGIVLEDDILPVPGFFAFCEELLARYRGDDRVWAISGCNFVADRHRADASYLFSHHNHVWGWASWRRSWQRYDLEMRQWPQWARSGALLRHLGGDRCAADYWREKFRRIYRGHEPSAWDYQWMLSAWEHDALTILPAHNLVTNLGFGAAATNTTKPPAGFITRNPARDIGLPLRHPARVERDAQADLLLRRHVTGLTHWRCLKRSLRRLRPGAAQPD